MVEELAVTLPGTLVLECDVTQRRHDRRGRGPARRPSGARSRRWCTASRSRARRTSRASSWPPRARIPDGAGRERLLAAQRHQPHAPLLEKNGASIVTLSYLAAERAVPSYNVMGSAKAVLEQSVRQLAYELGPKNVRVNALSGRPGHARSRRAASTASPTCCKKHAEKAPLKRNITKDEVGKAGLFLLSDLASGITGEVLYVDAGYHIMGW